MTELSPTAIALPGSPVSPSPPACTPHPSACSDFVLAAAVLLAGVEAPYGRYYKAKGKGFAEQLMNALPINGTFAWVVQAKNTHTPPTRLLVGVGTSAPDVLPLQHRKERRHSLWQNDSRSARKGSASSVRTCAEGSLPSVERETRVVS